VRRAARNDANQDAIVRQLRDAGLSVLVLSRVGNGCPDLLVGYRQQNYLFEVKDGSKPESARRLTPAEVRFCSSWKGQVRVAESAEDIFMVVNKP
jgi:hypothetical protein